MSAEAHEKTALETVDEARARQLADEYGLPPLEVNAALYGETLKYARSVLNWIDREETKLTHAHGLIAGRKLYEPVRMLKSYARKYKTGLYRSAA